MNKSRKTLIFMLILLAVAAAAVIYWFMQHSDRIQAEGKWALTSGDTGCFTGIRFMNNPAASGGAVSIEATSGSLVQMSYGSYEYDGDNQILITLANSDVPAFPVTLGRNGNELSATFKLKDEEAVCSYTLNVFK
ncbi:hypothetical protein [Paenibacillus sp. MMS20-IR301]|uniref:hypothetical protein n=1 Tax=Paenibacillus sp. MMS20-IR301 TaxID=2895946 RepID=UPI0028ED26DF|nr:hypothetical protein [Paenibacillus sp. MMS20-IR301]WNS40804.1 hypothetical protein LOS79_17240 [Paenibacillus sp. MMS20-IR301]